MTKVHHYRKRRQPYTGNPRLRNLLARTSMIMLGAAFAHFVVGVILWNPLITVAGTAYAATVHFMARNGFGS
jgi:uncharacterized membrane protein